MSPHQISVTPSEVRAYASGLHSAATNWRGVLSSVRSATQTLQQHWDDPAFRAFKDIIDQHNNHLDKAIRDFEDIAKRLNDTSQRMEDDAKLHGQMVNDMPR